MRLLVTDEQQCTYPGHRKCLDIIKTLLQMRLHSLRILGLTQNLQKVIIGQEVEAREDLPLGFQVHIQRLLDFLQLAVHLVGLFQESLMVSATQSILCFEQASHDGLPAAIDLIEFS